MKHITLTGKYAEGRTAIVDDADYNEVMKHNWYMTKHGYAATSIKNKNMWMHHFLIGKKEGFVVDHINSTRLDNRRANLRHITRTQNALKRLKPKRNISGYKGVFYEKNVSCVKKWRAEIAFQYKNHNIGRFHTAKEAALAYDEAAKKYFGEFAILNFEN